MKPPTPKQIAAEIAKLESLRGKVPAGTLTDNRAAIAAQIAVLKEKLSHDDIYDRWPDDERDVDVRCDALNAREWRNGEKEEKPSDGWVELIT